MRALAAVRDGKSCLDRTLSDRVLVMQRGRIEMSGTAAEIGDQLVAVQERYLS